MKRRFKAVPGKGIVASTIVESSADNQSIESQFINYLHKHGWDDETIEYAYEDVRPLSDINIHDAAEVLSWLEDFAWAGDETGNLDAGMARDWAGKVYRAVFKDL